MLNMIPQSLFTILIFLSFFSAGKYPRFIAICLNSEQEAWDYKILSMQFIWVGYYGKVKQFHLTTPILRCGSVLFLIFENSTAAELQAIGISSKFAYTVRSKARINCMPMYLLRDKL